MASPLEVFATLELTEVPPRIVKFDLQLIRDIDKQPAQRQTLLSRLVAMVLELGVTPLAEGIETAEEADVCRSMGFELAQGYFFGRPAPIKTIYG